MAFLLYRSQMLRVQDISYSYVGHFSLGNVSFSVKQGEIYGLIGQSGSGKSTLLNILAGFKEPHNGIVLLNGEQLPPPSRKLVPGHPKVKLVTQKDTLFPNVNVYENIVYELRYFEKSYQKKRATVLAKKLNITHLLNKLPRELSGGEVQRVMIAKALADEPWVLLLDEPMANLDRIHKEKVTLNVLEAIRSENIACLWVSHDMMEVFGLADKLLILKDGKLVQKGDSRSIYTKPKNRYVASLTGELNQIEGKYFRPESIQIAAHGEYEGTVISSLFRGFYYQIVLDVNGDRVWFRHTESIDSQTIISFDLNSVFHFN